MSQNQDKKAHPGTGHEQTSTSADGSPLAERRPTGNPGTGGQTGQFGQPEQGGRGTDLTREMESTGSGISNTPGDPDLIPWDPAGKIDDEVERRARPGSGTAPSLAGHGDAAQGLRGGESRGGQTLGSPKGGGAAAEGTGPGRYRGEAQDGEQSPNRYAGASDEAPTSPSAAATTTLASAAAGSQHELRQTKSSGGNPDSNAQETWEGGAATQEAMGAGGDFAQQAQPPVQGGQDVEVLREHGGSKPHGNVVEPYRGHGGHSEVH